MNKIGGGTQNIGGGCEDIGDGWKKERPNNDGITGERPGI